MSSPWILHALRRVVEENDRDAGEIALRSCDPLLARFYRKRFAKLLYEAELESGRDGAADVARLASFRFAKKETEGSFDDPDALKREYERAFSHLKEPKKGPRVTLGLVGSFLAIAVSGYSVHLHTRPFEPAQLPAGRLFEHDFTRLAVALANRNSDIASADLRAIEDAAVLKGSAAKSLIKLAEASMASDLESDGRNAYRAAAVGLNRDLEQAGEPYYVDADLFPLGGKLSPVLMSFYVQERGTYASGSLSIPVLRLWRLDHLNIVQSRLGYTRASSPYAILLLDLIERDLVTQILPALPDGEPMSLTDQDTELSREKWVASLQQAGGRIVEKHYASQPSEIREAAARLGALLAQRRSLLSDWKDKLGSKMGGVRMPRRLIPEADYTEELSLLVPRKGLRAWEDLHERLLTEESIADFERVREEALRSVERHEVQHRLDYAEERVEIPERLARRLGGIERMGHATHSHPMSATTELSAYLSEMADNPAPLLAILVMSRLFLTKSTMRSSHSYAGIVALEESARMLGIDTEQALGRSITRQELAELMVRVCEFSPDEIRAAARKAYVSLFGHELQRVSRGEFIASTAWRH